MIPLPRRGTGPQAGNSFPEKRKKVKRKPVIVMPTIFTLFGLRFSFYSDDHEPVHVHVTNAGREAKYNVQPVEMVYNHGFKKNELSLIESIVEENVDVITERWNETIKQK